MLGRRDILTLSTLDHDGHVKVYEDEPINAIPYLPHDVMYADIAVEDARNVV